MKMRTLNSEQRRKPNKQPKYKSLEVEKVEKYDRFDTLQENSSTLNEKYVLMGAFFFSQIGLPLSSKEHKEIEMRFL